MVDRDPENVLMPSSMLRITRMGAMLCRFDHGCQGEQFKIL